MATVSNWNFFNANVQSGLLEGRYMNAAFTMLAAGPPRLSAVGVGSTAQEELGNIAWPVGVLQSVNLGINSQWMRLWEIGSERSYFIRGRTVGQLSLGRIMYHGPNLLRSLYAYLDVDGGVRGNGQLYPNSAQALLNTTKNSDLSKSDFKVPPGFQNIWLELASDVFSQPVGLLLYMKDSNEDTVAAFYIEYCNVANFGWSTDAGGTIMSENASIMYERIKPIEMAGVPIIADSTSIENIVGGNVIGSAASPLPASNG